MENRESKDKLKRLLNLANNISARYRLRTGLNLSNAESSSISKRHGELEEIFHNSEMELLINEVDDLDRIVDENHGHAKLYGNNEDVTLYEPHVTLEDASELKYFEGLPNYDPIVDEDLGYTPLD